MPEITPEQRAAAEKVLKKFLTAKRSWGAFVRNHPAPKGYFWYFQGDTIELIDAWSDDDDL